MNTHTNEYVMKISSGTILAILAFSGFLFLIPLATPVFASNASLPTVSVTSGNPVKAGVSTPVGLTVSNPSSNQFTVTAFTINAPSTWTITGSTAGTFLPSHPFSASSATWTVSVFSVGTGAGIPPGGSDSFTFTATPSTASSYPYTSTFTSKVQDASAVSFYTGPSFSLQVMDPTTSVTIVVTPGGSNTGTSYKAGTAPYTVTATVAPVQAGLPIVWSAAYTPSTASFSFTPSSGTTDSSGISSTTFKPSNHAMDSGTVKATVGTSTVASASSAAIVTAPGAPTSALFTSPFASTHYVTAFGTPSSSTGNWAKVPGSIITSSITASVADKFGNVVDLSTLGAYSFTITAIAAGGLFDAGGGTHPTSVTCGTGLTCPTTLGSMVVKVTFPYFQSGTYGSSGLLTASATGSSPAFAAAGSSGNIVTSTFDSSVNVPTLASAYTSGCAAAVPAVSSPCRAAGKTITLLWNATVVQAGVPLTFYLDTVLSSAGYAGTFSNSAQAITVATGSNGGAAAVFSVDTTANSTAKFFANFTRPTDIIPAGTMTPSGDTPSVVTTIAGAATSIKVKLFFTNTAGALTDPVGSSSVGGLTLWVNAIFRDAYGNTAVNPGPNVVQVTLTASGGLLSATTVYIPTGFSSTKDSFGPIAWTLPSGSGASYTLTASGVVSGTAVLGSKTISTVSANPTILVTSPATSGGVVYSSTTGVVFNGNANSSLGYPPLVTISSVTFSVDKGAASAATIVTGTNMVTWSAGVFFTVGLHNVTFTATDSNANTATSSLIWVLVDTSAPTVKFTTTTGATLNFGSSVTAVIVDTEGDLNATSVAATRNGTAIASANVAVGGTNNLGKNTTYIVTISNLPAGKWVLTLSASDLTGHTGSATSITVTVTVPFAQSVVINSAAYGSLGSFNGITVSATNVWSSSQNLVVFAVWKNSAGQTVAVTTGGLTLASGATGTAFAPLAGALPPGTYTVNVFVITTSNNPVSSTTTISVAV